jgi:protein gp37
MGCEGCELWNAKTGVKTCYAGVLHVRYGGKTSGFSPTFEQVTFYPGRMAEAAKWRDLTGTERKDKPWMHGLPRLVFVSDMSDTLSKVVSFEFLETEVIRTVASTDGQRHRWLWLTKRPERMAKLSDDLKARSIGWPENLWVGTSITSRATTSRIDGLLRVGNDKTIRFLSVEPQSENIDFRAWLPQLDWVTQGGESGAGSRPFHVEWATDLIGQCKEAGIAYFLKQLGSLVYCEGRARRFRDNQAGDWSEWPEHLRVRQMPGVATTKHVELAGGANPEEGNRVPLDVIEIQIESKGRQAALKAWATRRRNQAERQQIENGTKTRCQKTVGWVLFLNRGSPHTANRSRERGKTVDRAAVPADGVPGTEPGGGAVAPREGPTPDLGAILGRVYDELFQMTNAKRLRLADVLSGNLWLPT